LHNSYLTQNGISRFLISGLKDARIERFKGKAGIENKLFKSLTNIIEERSNKISLVYTKAQRMNKKVI
jgi:hypothetical protein